MNSTTEQCAQLHVCQHHCNMPCSLYVLQCRGYCYIEVCTLDVRFSLQVTVHHVVLAKPISSVLFTTLIFCMWKPQPARILWCSLHIKYLKLCMLTRVEKPTFYSMFQMQLQVTNVQRSPSHSVYQFVLVHHSWHPCALYNVLINMAYTKIRPHESNIRLQHTKQPQDHIFLLLYNPTALQSCTRYALLHAIDITVSRLHGFLNAKM